MRGKTNRNHISEGQKVIIREHINSFPAIESHYCRARTNKKYLESNLNIPKMYDLYVSQEEKNDKRPVKASYYRYIFCTEFNIDFHVPKSDRCGTCEVYKNMEKENKEQETDIVKRQEEHQRKKLSMREQKKKIKNQISQF